MNKRQKVKVLQVKYSDYTTKTVYEYDATYIDDLFQDSYKAAGQSLSAKTIEVIKSREEAGNKRLDNYKRYKDLL
jgi:hypothetical protein